MDNLLFEYVRWNYKIGGVDVVLGGLPPSSHCFFTHIHTRATTLPVPYLLTLSKAKASAVLFAKAVQRQRQKQFCNFPLFVFVRKTRCRTFIYSFFTHTANIVVVFLLFYRIKYFSRSYWVEMHLSEHGLEHSNWSSYLDLDKEEECTGFQFVYYWQLLHSSTKNFFMLIFRPCNGHSHKKIVIFLQLPTFCASSIVPKNGTRKRERKKSNTCVCVMREKKQYKANMLLSMEICL